MTTRTDPSDQPAHPALDKQFLFIVGSPRSGTTWLSHLLLEHPDVAGIPGVELTLFSRYLGSMRSFYEKERADIQADRWEQGLPVVLDQDGFLAHLRSLTGAVYAEVLKMKPDATCILDKHPNYANHLATIDQVLPNAKIIHIIRDGRMVARSMMSVRQRVGHSPGNIREAAWKWSRYVTNARAFGAQHPERYHEVRYEDLMSSGVDEMKEILRFCGLDEHSLDLPAVLERSDISNAKFSRGIGTGINANASKMKLWHRWLFDRIAGKLLMELRYAEQGWWAERWYDRLLISFLRPLFKFYRLLTGAKTFYMQAIEDVIIIKNDR